MLYCVAIHCKAGLTAPLCLQVDLEICRYWLDKYVPGSADQASAFEQEPSGKQAAATCGSGATPLGTQQVAQAPPTETIWCRSETICPEPSRSTPDEHIARLANQLTKGALKWPYSCTGSGTPRRAAAPDAVMRGGAELALVTDLDLCSLYCCCRRLSTA